MITNGVVMITSASSNSWSNLDPGWSLSEVVTKVWPWSSSHLRRPSSFSVVPKSPGTCSACSWPYEALKWAGSLLSAQLDRWRATFEIRNCSHRTGQVELSTRLLTRQCNLHSFNGTVSKVGSEKKSVQLPYWQIFFWMGCFRNRWIVLSEGELEGRR